MGVLLDGHSTVWVHDKTGKEVVNRYNVKLNDELLLCFTIWQGTQHMKFGRTSASLFQRQGG